MMRSVLRFALLQLMRVFGMRRIATNRTTFALSRLRATSKSNEGMRKSQKLGMLQL